MVYVNQYQRELQSKLELIYDKYTITLNQILNGRNDEAEQLNEYLKELGYE